MKILMIEDGEYKRDRVSEFLCSEFENIELTIKESFSTGVKEILGNSFDLLILDMSLPTFDKNDGGSGGDFRVNGGLELAEKLKRKNKLIPFIFLTQYTSFSNNDQEVRSIENIDLSSKNKFGENYLGYIYYEHAKFEWKSILEEVIKSHVKNISN